jgi:hypothetical protein
MLTDAEAAEVIRNIDPDHALVDDLTRRLKEVLDATELHPIIVIGSLASLLCCELQDVENDDVRWAFRNAVKMMVGAVE